MFTIPHLFPPVRGRQEEAPKSWQWTWDAGPKPKPRKPSRSASQRRKELKAAKAAAGKGAGSGSAPWSPSPFVQTDATNEFGKASTYRTMGMPTSPWTPTADSVWPPPAEKGDKSGTSSATTALNQELVQALRDSYPDHATMPSKVREVLDRQTTVSTKQLNTDMRKATGILVKARNNLKSLQENRAKHRHSWLQHLSSTLKTWTEHMTSYDQQQKEFHNMIRAAKRELAAARAAVQELNQQAGKVSAADSDQEEVGPKEAETVIKDEEALRTQTNGLLAQCVQGASSTAKIEVDGDMDVQAISDSDTEKPASKRARSAEARTTPAEEVTPAEGVGG